MEVASTIEQVQCETVSTTINVFSAVRELAGRGLLTIEIHDSGSVTGTVLTREEKLYRFSPMGQDEAGNEIDPLAMVLLGLLGAIRR